MEDCLNDNNKPPLLPSKAKSKRIKTQHSTDSSIVTEKVKQSKRKATDDVSSGKINQ